MKPDRRILLVVEAVVVQVTDKVWKPIHHLPEDLQGLNVCEVLISRGDESAKDTPCKCCLDIFSTKTRPAFLIKLTEKQKLLHLRSDCRILSKKVSSE